MSELSAVGISGPDGTQNRRQPDMRSDTLDITLSDVPRGGRVWLSWMLRGADWRMSHVHRCQSCRRRFADDEPGCIPPGEERFAQLCRCDLGRGLGHTNCRASGPYCPACAARISDEQREIDEWEREWLLTGPPGAMLVAVCSCH